ncbi:putative L-aspartate oxidase [Staphylococcus piscifermentans]|uniref:L-aspartate oxidase n=1 Tax=Staphylococcus piscifermentans TaxID=70258 RepID=A0A239TZZ5_9STAP|nr:FAD-binding protein [Staphylococcus piscifermentans]RTX84729.1 FAD-binding protein [Staphylococcus piscifermentans]GEP85637.1 L-aspartate oxidase [Staphylococcus piscifermentans]SNV02718.1 putative L-aspartate oxidase [Staphylococcus piscifermentans]
MRRVIVVGSGIAALSFIRHLNHDIEVVCITKDQLTENNSNFAQGGICFSKNESDNGLAHSIDTFKAGAEMGDFEVIQEVITKSYPFIQELIDEGLSFDKNSKSGELDYAMEGAHCKPRILHAGGDQTGKFIAQHMVAHLDHPNLSIIEETEVIDLLTNTANEICGVLTLDCNNNLESIEADAVVLATGGINNVFTTNSNIPHSLASGPILALHHGLTLESMEMIQFHPTLLGKPKEAFSLVSEAVRGAGAILVNETGKQFMDELHPMKSLAPRDVTSRALYHQQQEGHECFLNIQAIPHFPERFPTIYAAVQKHYPGAMLKQLIPVTPGAHYTVGGIQTKVDGSTAYENLYAVGEAACTNFHGANRLASNSLLEGLVMGALAADKVNRTIRPIDPIHFQHSIQIPVITEADAQTLQHQSFDVLGVERNAVQMKTYLEKIQDVLTDAPITENITKSAWQRYCTVKMLQLICTSAIERNESRGVHYRTDFPTQNNSWQKQVVELKSGGKENVKSITRTRENHSILH